MTMLSPDLAPEFWKEHSSAEAEKATIFVAMRQFVASHSFQEVPVATAAEVPDVTSH